MYKKLLSVILLFLFVETLHAADLQFCFRQASLKYNVPVKILKSIAKSESNNNIFAINVNGKSYKPKTIFSAQKIISENEKKSFDIGIMQVNKLWFKKMGYPYEIGFDPCFNIMFGAYILRKKMNQYGENWYGIAAYHSTTPKKNIRYAWRIYQNLR